MKPATATLPKGSFSIAAAVWSCAVWLGTLAFAAPVGAQEKWAAVSLVGDQLTVVYPRMQTGSNMRRNWVQMVPVPDDSLDRMALAALVRAAEQRTGSPEIVSLALRDERYFRAQSDLLTGNSERELLDGLLKAVEPTASTHLLLIAKQRGEANFRTYDGHIGIGQVEGLGFYVDRETRLRLTDRIGNETGYLAPFTYLRLVLFDIGKRSIVATEYVRASSLFPVAGSPGRDPWELADSAQKAREIDRLLKQEIGAGFERLQKVR